MERYPGKETGQRSYQYYLVYDVANFGSNLFNLPKTSILGSFEAFFPFSLGLLVPVRCRFPEVVERSPCEIAPSRPSISSNHPVASQLSTSGRGVMMRSCPGAVWLP